jgi:hypothetical protein
VKKNFFIPILVCLFSVTIMSSCRKCPDYTGAWEMTIEGTCNVTKTVIVNDDGSFGFQLDCGGVVNKIDGNVDLESGKVLAAISLGGLELCGSGVTGTMNENGTGSGTFQCAVFVAGGWTAYKIQ